MKKILLALAICNLMQLTSFAQITKRTEFKTSSIYTKKFLWGFAVNNSWANYQDTRDSSFFRPSLGIHARVEYNLLENLHISLGGGLQQRGMGIYTPDLNNSIGNQDSTGRLRYKCSTIDFPLEIAFRPKKEIFNNVRFHVGLGVTTSVMYRAQRIWKSLDDGFHVPQTLTKDYKKVDFPLRTSIGIDVDAPGNILFRLQGVFEYGFAPIYTNPVSGIKSNRNILMGIDLTFLF